MRLPKDEPPTSPGEMLLEEFMRPFALSARQLAFGINVPPNRVSQIVQGARSITSDTALRLSRYFGTTPEFWLNLQMGWDLWHELHGENAKEVQRIKPFPRARHLNPEPSRA